MHIVFNNVTHVKLDFKMLVKIKRKSTKMQNAKIFQTMICMIRLHLKLFTYLILYKTFSCLKLQFTLLGALFWFCTRQCYNTCSKTFLTAKKVLSFQNHKSERLCKLKSSQKYSILLTLLVLWAFSVLVTFRTE